MFSKVVSLQLKQREIKKKTNLIKKKNVPIVQIVDQLVNKTTRECTRPMTSTKNIAAVLEQRLTSTRHYSQELYQMRIL